MAKSFIDHLVEDHCDPSEVGRVASRADVGTLVLYHLIPGNVAVTDEQWQAKVRRYHAGQIVVARDLLVV